VQSQSISLFGILYDMNVIVPGIDYIGISTPFYCIDGKGKILMHKRSKNCRDEQGMWDPGGGKLDFLEDVVKCVLREVKEEYGCAGEILHQFDAHSVIRLQNGKKTHWLAVPFIVRVDPSQVRINEPDKIDEIGWFTLDNLPTPIHSAFEKYILKTDRILILKQFLQE